MKDIAAFYGVHRTTLHRIICESKKISPKAFIIKRRLVKAVDLLRNSSLAIRNIAEICGFSDAGYFSKRCMEEFAKLPGDIRKDRPVRKKI